MTRGCPPADCLDERRAETYTLHTPARRADTVRNTGVEGERHDCCAAAARIAQIVPEVRAHVHDLPDVTVPADAESPDARFPLFDATVTFLRTAAREQPLLLIFDDLHAADQPSLLLLHFLARELRDVPLLVVGTYRDVEAQRHPERARTLSSVARNGQRIPLGGWSE